MYHIVNPTTLYDVVNELRIELELYKNKESVDVAHFLDDVSMWMDKNRPKLSDDYLPFSVLSVGIVPVQVSAFMYGLFIGKAIEKHGLTIKTRVTKVSKEEILKEIQRNIDHYGNLPDNDSKKKNKGFGGKDGKAKDTR